MAVARATILALHAKPEGREFCLLSIVGMPVIPSVRHSNVANVLMTAAPAPVSIMKCPTKNEVYHARVSRGSYIG